MFRNDLGPFLLRSVTIGGRFATFRNDLGQFFAAFRNGFGSFLLRSASFGSCLMRSASIWVRFPAFCIVWFRFHQFCIDLGPFCCVLPLFGSVLLRSATIGGHFCFVPQRCCVVFAAFRNALGPLFAALRND